MNGQQLVSRLREHQDGIRANIDRARRTLDQPGGPDRTELARLRWELVRLLTAYGHFKHREIFDPIIAASRFEQARAARQLRANCLAMEGDVRAFVGRRSVPPSGETAEDYRADVRAFAARVGAHMAEERDGVTRLLTPPPPARTTMPSPAPAAGPPMVTTMRRPDRPTPAG